MLRSDLVEVRDIEQRAYRYPWSKTVFLDCIAAGYQCRVLQTSQGLAGYGILSAAAGEAHLLNLCVCPRWQGRGLSRLLLEHLLQLAARQRVETVFLEVRPSNAAALRLYHQAGFCELGVRPGYYPAPGGREDALLMAKTL